MQRLISLETYLIVVLILVSDKYTSVYLYDFHKKQNIFNLYVAIFLFKQDKARTELGKCNRKIQKEKNAKKKRKKCQNF